MMFRFWLQLFVLLLLVVGCPDRESEVGGSAEPTERVARSASARPAPSPAKMTGDEVKVSYFGEQTIEDGAIALMDGGTHGVQGHTVRLAADGKASWERRVDGMRPAGKAGSGKFQPSAEELERLRQARDRLWELAAPGGDTRFYPPPQQGPPRWVWAIVMRRGDEIRVLSGGAIARGRGGLPSEARDILEWLGDRVDDLAAGR